VFHILDAVYYVSAVGCEVFADNSSLVILNQAKCKERSECSGEKMANLRIGKKKCRLLSNKTSYLHNDTWKALKIENGCFDIRSYSNDKVYLKVNKFTIAVLWCPFNLINRTNACEII
jgi:hypothetical protein